ncbi:unnamed protein product [Adineta steineri]|uniref:F-box domain-containing protein n=1 Tax=Adineta steineri TaxID=433720 RepID=A0A814INJ9_9BILA|nr:unnamed protein product [Adineta steineri]CAF1119555.1 unnamed protein product [Adineta steineri]
MNNELLCSFTHLEDLPDELVLAIFVYIPVQTLYDSFRNINQRLNSILTSVRLSVRIEVNEDRNQLLITSVQHFAPQINSLHIALWCQHLDLTKFQRIQSLYISRPTFVQLMSIQPEHLPELRTLSIKYATPLKYDHIDDFYRLIISNRFKQLRFVRQDGADLRLEHYVVENKYLHLLYIGSCELQHWPDLLKALPALCQFTATMFYLTPPIAVATSFQHMALRHLNIVLDEYYDVIDDLEKVIWFTPILTHLAVRCRHSLPPIDFFGLSDMLAECTPRLKHFRCRFNLVIKKNEKIAEVDHIRQISPLFTTIHYKQHETRSQCFIVATEPMMDEYRQD